MSFAARAKITKLCQPCLSREGQMNTTAARLIFCDKRIKCCVFFK